ncbi:MAG: hypothetical protein JJE47_02600 [Acidimicrobiia bacterium]|nr:hypothetical protein [Acidimicrobiia bacterium]
MPNPVDTDGLQEKFDAWIGFVEANHHGKNNRINDEIAFQPLKKPLSESTMALVTTAGAHLDDQTPFHVETVAGDAGYRQIPHDVDQSRLRFTHTHYDTSSAEIDPNVVLPIDRLNEAVAAGRVGAAAPFHMGMMGFNPDPSELQDVSGPAVASRFADAGVDIVLLVPG